MHFLREKIASYGNFKNMMTLLFGSIKKKSEGNCLYVRLFEMLTIRLCLYVVLFIDNYIEICFFMWHVPPQIHILFGRLRKNVT